MEKSDKNDMSIDDILKSVDQVISEKDKILEDDSPYEELELTDVADDSKSSKASNEPLHEKVESLISEKIQHDSQKIISEFAETAKTLGKDVNIPKEIPASSKSVENFILDIIKPQIKDWLDANLPIIVKQIVSEEIKRMVADMNNNSK